MRIFGRELTFRKSAAAAQQAGTIGAGGFFPWIREPFTGAWQKNEEWSAQTVMAHYAVYACTTLIANDFAKLRPRLMQLTADGIWIETTSPAFSPVLRKFNDYQTHVQFKQWWMSSKLTYGNAYALKHRDARGLVVQLTLLDPRRVIPLVAPDGEIFYRCMGDYLNQLGSEGVTLPASEIIHDRINPLFHPLIGISPLYACALSATQGLQIQNDSSRFFQNGSKPGGILTAPGAISDETANRLKTHWDANYTGANAGKVAVVGDGLQFHQMQLSATDSKLIEQLKLTAEQICTAFHVPPFKVGIGEIPRGLKVADLNQLYYSDCLQSLIEDWEAIMDDGLSLPTQYGVDLDLDGLLRMDMASQVATLTAAVKGSIMTTNEGRGRLNLPPVPGGDVVTAQQQDYSLEALAKRDANDPFSKAAPATPAVTPDPNAAAPAPDPNAAKALTDQQIQDSAKMLALLIEKRLANEPA
jgi:HK97 family phage portal protein